MEPGHWLYKSAKGAVRAPKRARNTRVSAADGSSVLRVFLNSAKGAVRAPKLARNTRVTAADGGSVLRVFLNRLGRVAATLPNNIVEAHTVQGDVELNTTSLTRASTVNGSIKATLSGPNPADLRTVNGNLTVTVPRLDGPLLTLWTTHGDIRVLTR